MRRDRIGSWNLVELLISITGVFPVGKKFGKYTVE